MTETKIITIGQEASMAGSVDVTVSATWTGTLQKAVIGGKLKINEGPGLGDLRGKLKVNGVEVGPDWDMALVQMYYAEGSFSIDVTQYLVQGANDFTFFTYVAWGLVPVLWTRIDGTLTLTASSVTIVVPPGPTDWTTLILIAIGLIAVIAIAGVALKWSR